MKYMKLSKGPVGHDSKYCDTILAFISGHKCTELRRVQTLAVNSPVTLDLEPAQSRFWREYNPLLMTA